MNGKIISNFDKRVELFSSHFASQCPPVNNSSVLPPLEYKANGPYIYLILKNLNPGKVQWWDNILIKMFQTCGKAIVEPLQICFPFFRRGWLSRWLEEK